MTTQLNDDPSLLDGPIGFAVNVCAADQSDIDALRRRLPGLLLFARTFYANILEAEFGISLGAFPQPARERAARLDADLKHREKGPEARRLIMNLIDLCDFVIDSDGGYVEDEEREDRDEYYDEIVVLVERLLQRFASWVDPMRFPRLADAARHAVSQFAEASVRLSV